MDRLTRNMCGGYGMVEGYELNTLQGVKATVNRLAAYEDTGLEPEDIPSVAEMQRQLETYLSLGSLEHLTELCKAESKDRVWILPDNWTVGLVNSIMALAERVRAGKVAKGHDNIPMVTWQLYNMLVEASRIEAEEAFGGEQP